MEVSELSLMLDAAVVAREVDTHSRACARRTLEYDELDRVTRATILRHVMEQERRDLSAASVPGTIFTPGWRNNAPGTVIHR